MRTVVAFAFALTLTAACAPLSDPSSKPVELDGTHWTLTAIGGKAPIAGSNVTLKFEQGSASGSAGCNSYHSTYTTTGSKLELGPTASTKRACLERDKNAQETAYLEALSKVVAYEVSGGRLMLRDAADATLLEFAAAH
jgi:heat shock protein HslJ